MTVLERIHKHCPKLLQIEQNSTTKNGTLISTAKPWKIETITKSLPENRVIIGRVVSIVVAPPAEMGASLPKHLTSKGAKRSVMISRMMLDSRAMVPKTAPLYSVMKILDSE